MSDAALQHNISALQQRFAERAKQVPPSGMSKTEKKQWRQKQRSDLSKLSVRIRGSLGKMPTKSKMQNKNK